MNEPLLVFKKGEGWVYDTTPPVVRHAITGRDGLVYYLAERYPKRGELYICQLNLSECISIAKQYSVGDYADFAYDDHARYDGYYLCTVEES